MGMAEGGHHNISRSKLGKIVKHMYWATGDDPKEEKRIEDLADGLYRLYEIDPNLTCMLMAAGIEEYKGEHSDSPRAGGFLTDSPFNNRIMEGIQNYLLNISDYTASPEKQECQNIDLLEKDVEEIIPALAALYAGCMPNATAQGAARFESGIRGLHALYDEEPRWACVGLALFVDAYNSDGLAPSERESRPNPVLESLADAFLIRSGIIGPVYKGT